MSYSRAKFDEGMLACCRYAKFDRGIGMVQVLGEECREISTSYLSRNP